MAFVFQKVAEFEEKEDGSYESLGFEDCQTSMPPKPSTSVPSRGDWKRGQKRQFEAGNEGRKRKDSDSRGVKHKSRDQKEKNNKEGPKYENIPSSTSLPCGIVSNWSVSASE